MCYLCLKGDEFLVKSTSTRDKKLARTLELKKIIRLIESGTDIICDDGSNVITKLKEEQYMLSREL